MNIKLFCVLDYKLGQFNTPMAFQSTGLAYRAFQDEVNRDASDNPMFKYPDDFSLHYVGEFNTFSGCFSPPEKGIPEVVVQGREVKM